MAWDYRSRCEEPTESRTLTLSLLAVTVTLAACGATPHKVAAHEPKSTTSTTIDSAGVAATTTTHTDTSTSIAITPATVTASVPDCTANDLTMTARPQYSSYSWNETMEVIVELSNRSGSSCQVLPDTLIVGDTSDGCEPDLVMEFYDAGLSPSTGLLGPYQRPCPSAPSVVAPGAPTTVQVAAAFECGPGAQACAVSHDGNETWDVRVEWQLALGQNLGAGFNVLVVTPPEPVTTTTTAQSTSTTTTSAQSTTTSTSTTTIGP